MKEYERIFKIQNISLNIKEYKRKSKKIKENQRNSKKIKE